MSSRGPKVSLPSVGATPLQIPTPFMTTADVVLDANIIVGHLDPGDSQHAKAEEFVEALRNSDFELVLLDFLVEEALSVLSRRAREPKSGALHLGAAIDTVEEWHKAGHIQPTGELLATAFPRVLEIVRKSGGVLNTNDAKLVYLQRSDLIGDVASFDRALSSTPGFRCLVFPFSGR